METLHVFWADCITFTFSAIVFVAASVVAIGFWVLVFYALYKGIKYLKALHNKRINATTTRAGG